MHKLSDLEFVFGHAGIEPLLFELPLVQTIREGPSSAAQAGPGHFLKHRELTTLMLILAARSPIWFVAKLTQIALPWMALITGPRKELSSQRRSRL
jgi:hypothetical protein